MISDIFIACLVLIISLPILILSLSMIVYSRYNIKLLNKKIEYDIMMLELSIKNKKRGVKDVID